MSLRAPYGTLSLAFFAHSYNITVLISSHLNGTSITSNVERSVRKFSTLQTTSMEYRAADKSTGESPKNYERGLFILKDNDTITRVMIIHK